MSDTVKLLIELPEKTVSHIRSDYGHGKGYYPLNDEDKKIVNDAIYNGIALNREIEAIKQKAWDTQEVDGEHDNHKVVDLNDVMDILDKSDSRAEKLNNLSSIRHAIEEYDLFKG